MRIIISVLFIDNVNVNHMTHACHMPALPGLVYINWMMGCRRMFRNKCLCKYDYNACGDL